ncbi:FAD-dependent oxidoreductase [Saccharothrix variisporea]|uniref:Thioredoxin reductase (NADPH) n=1 Tax=Saccharothrix variisporea TaxID=543527 RepID=A0A495X4T3_9PSEU|nr:FAD-dependent oxidoreductase [Saccharothrix variisporea]RKT69000.1 thioredoxin reductase (NADPH) [Saccharothrix variisporea]
MSGAGLRVVARVGSARAHAIQDFLTRNQVQFDVGVDPGASDAVVVHLPGGGVLNGPSLIELATALGLTDEAEPGDHDLVVVGGGPAGLSAAVYSACEGLRVVVVEDDTPGGQAGSTSRIENYLGFPAGLSGGDLARRALAQARRFGVRWLSARRATGLRRDGELWTVHTDDGTTARGTAVLVATGMRWRTLDVPGAAELAGLGVYHGASTIAADDHAFVLGAGNSAGQAALHLAEHGTLVTLVVRGPSLGDSPMSRYLVNRIAESPAIEVLTGTTVEAVRGEGRLAEVVLRRGGAVEVRPGTALYVLIGMTPCTGWLGGQAVTDARGFLVTGTDLLRIEGAWPLARAPLLTETTLPGVFAAGDVRSGTVKRIGSAIGQGAVAGEAVLEYVKDAAAPRVPEQVSSFDLLDADHDGWLREEDLATFARRLVAAFDEPPESVRAARVHSACQEFWTSLTRVTGREEVDRAVFADLAREVDFAPLADAVLLLSDTDADGSVTLGEFQRLLAALGAPAESATAAFRVLDQDGTGYLDTTRLAAGGALLGGR